MALDSYATRAYRGTHTLPAAQVLLGHAVFAELHEGTAPSTIARKVGVGDVAGPSSAWVAG